MFNPFIPFLKEYLPEFMKKGVTAFVMQSYPRGTNLLDDRSRKSVVMFHYDDVGLAKGHYGVKLNDPEARLFNLKDANDLQALNHLLRDPAYLVHSRLMIKDVKEKARKFLHKYLKDFIDNKLQWRVKGEDSVDLDFKLEYGDIMIKLTYGSLFAQVALDVINPVRQDVL